jgi:hypothetical protein
MHNIEFKNKKTNDKNLVEEYEIINSKKYANNDI